MLAGATAASGVGAAEDGSSTDDACAFCTRRVAETDTHVYVTTVGERNPYLYRAERGGGRIEFQSVADRDVGSLTEERVRSMEGFEVGANDATGIYENIGGCGFPAINNHYYAGVAMETPKNPNKYAVSALAGMICTAIGISTPIPGDSVLFGGFCSAAATAVQELAFDSTFTVGGYDRDGWVPEIKGGVSGEYDADHENLDVVATGPGHIGPLT